MPTAPLRTVEQLNSIINHIDHVAQFEDDDGAIIHAYEMGILTMVRLHPKDYSHMIRVLKNRFPALDLNKLKQMYEEENPEFQLERDQDLDKRAHGTMRRKTGKLRRSKGKRGKSKGKPSKKVVSR